MTLVIDDPYAPRYFQTWILVSPCVCSSPYLTGLLLTAQRTLGHHDNQGKDANGTRKLTSLTICCPIINCTWKHFLFILWVSSVYIVRVVCVYFSEFIYILGSSVLYIFKLFLRIT